MDIEPDYLPEEARLIHEECKGKNMALFTIYKIVFQLLNGIEASVVSFILLTSRFAYGHCHVWRDDWRGTNETH